MTAQTTPRHRVSVATAEMRAAAAAVVDASVWSMTEAETAAALVELTRHEAEVAELKARVAAHADDLHLGQDAGAASAATWLAHTSKTTRPAAHGTVKLGHDLEHHPLTREALAHGDIVADQARAILRAVDHLPDDLDTDLVAKAEAHLLEQAAHFDATTLTRLGKHLFEVIAPDEADAREAKILEAEEAAAARKISLRYRDDGHGRFDLHVTGPTLNGAALMKMVMATAAPKHRAALGIQPRPSARRLGEAFWELMERYPTKKLPKSGGLPATLLVLIDEDSLMGRVEKVGVLDTGERISPRMVRQLACQAGIIPIVLGGDSMPLDVGRKRRLHTDHQRYALLARDQGCRAEGCDRTVGLQAHHKITWADGGHTNLRDAITLCHWHHNKAHDPTYDTTYHPNGDVTFHRRE